MRILQVNLVYGPEIADPEALLDRYEVLTGWSDALRDAGAGAIAVVQRFPCDAGIERGGVTYTFLADGAGPTPSPAAWIGRLYRHVAAWRPDVVHVNGLHLPFQWWALRRHLPAATIVVQDHAGRGPSRDRPAPVAFVRQIVAGRAFAAADAFLFTTAELAKPWLESGLVAPDRVREVPEASTAFRPVPRDEARRTSGVTGSPAVLWVGRLEAVKDPITTLQGFARARSRLPGATLTVVHNGGTLEDAVQRAVRSDRALSAGVRLLADVPRPRLPAFYSAADLFVLGSRFEGSGLAFLEAMACGTWPVVPDIPAFRTLTGGGRYGSLWSAGQPDSMAEALVGAAALGGRRETLQSYFERQLSWRAVGDRAMRIYTEVSATRRRNDRRTAAARV